MQKKLEFAFLNIGHFYDHFFMLIFATASALALTTEWGLEYSELIPYATPGFVAFGVCAIPAGWLADRWSKRKMMLVFFIGLGTGSILTSQASEPWIMGFGLTVIGAFAAIYHPVGLALVVEKRDKTGMPLALNGVFGNLGVASAALITGFLIDYDGWKPAFAWPGILCFLTGFAYWFLVVRAVPKKTLEKESTTNQIVASERELDIKVLIRAFCIVLITTAFGGLIFQSTTFALPKVLHERLSELAGTATLVGQYAFWVFALAAAGQLVVGYFVDRYPIRFVFALVALVQATAMAFMVGTDGWLALPVTMVFMLGVFGQIPINDVIIGRITASNWRSRVFAMRYIISFSVMASTVPLIAWIHSNWGFDRLFAILSTAAACIFTTVLALPKSVSAR